MKTDIFHEKARGKPGAGRVANSGGSRLWFMAAAAPFSLLGAFPIVRQTSVDGQAPTAPDRGPMLFSQRQQISDQRVLFRFREPRRLIHVKIMAAAADVKGLQPGAPIGGDHAGTQP